MTQARSFSELMKSVNWNKLKYGDFMVPDFSTEGESVIVETPIANIIKNCKGCSLKENSLPLQLQ